MTPTGTSSLPIIDISSFLDNETQNADKRASVAAALHSACIEYGFFYLNIKAFVDLSEPEERTRLAREFFALPQTEKDKLSLMNEDGARGVCGGDLAPPITNRRCPKVMPGSRRTLPTAKPIITKGLISTSQ
jgi:isopenicillin N synthase-like dioxygenase